MQFALLSFIAQALRIRGADVTARSDSGFTPLMFAARSGDLELTRLLLDSDADVNTSVADGSTALLVATVRGHLALAEFLLEQGADPNVAPDVLVGYARYFRASWKTVLGGAPTKLIVANQNRWSGDHCIAADLVPGILVANRKIKVQDPNLTDVGPTILSLFGIETPSNMAGRPLFFTRYTPTRAAAFPPHRRSPPARRR